MYWLSGNSVQESSRSPHNFVMTVDVDGWWSLLNFYSVRLDPSEADSQVNEEEGILRLIQLFKRCQILATFFVPGEVATRHPEAIKDIVKAGHEVACHGLTHEKNECLLSRIAQERRIVEATKILEEMTGSRPVGFRAPCLRLNGTTLAILDKLGYTYDSSVLPTLIPGYYGEPFAGSRPYYPSMTDLTKEGSRGVLEIPVSVSPIVPIPLSGAWMRNLGSGWVKLGISANFAFGRVTVFYVHPRDVLDLPRVKGLPWHVYRRTGHPSLSMLEQIIMHSKTIGASFMRAVDFARLHSKTICNERRAISGLQYPNNPS
jgi:hypothetical protein